MEEVGSPKKDKKKINDHLTVLQILKERGMKGLGIISAYHMRRVAPLMVRALPLHQMVPRASLEGPALVDEALPLRSGAAHQGGDGALEGWCWRRSRFCVPNAEASPNVSGIKVH